MRFFARVMASELWWDVVLPKAGLGALSRRTRKERMRRIAVRFRNLAIRMGGVLIKVGQFMSARLDVMPREITSELAGLQDEVGAESFEAIRGEVEAEFGGPLHEKFLEFEAVPMASASIGQVHRARLCVETPEGTPCPPVVVKVQRPGIQQIVEADLAAIRAAGSWLQRFKSVRRHANVPALIDEFSRSLYEELDYLHEGKNAERFARNFSAQPEVVVPKVVWSHTTKRVLTLEDVGAIKITEYGQIEAAGIDRSEIARKLLDVYLKQVFEDGFFHADPHPGNLFVLPSRRPEGSRGRPGGWKLVFVDFGMTGSLSAVAFKGLREVLLAVGTRDASRLVRAFQALQVLLPGADLDLLERACKRVFDTIWGKSTREMMRMSTAEFSAFADEFGELLYEMPFQVPENLILLGRCVSILSGMATGLDPDFNVWQGLAPHVQKLVEKDGGTGWRLVVKELGDMARVLFGLPRRADDLATRIEQGRVDIRMPELKQHVARIEHGVRKLAGSIIFAGGLIAGTNLYLGGHLEIALGVGAAELILLVWILFAR
jgi:predicted unusual protein kinase regulating ubiquinone biosynthesis (AarF/ABC1/UbiB family)